MLLVALQQSVATAQTVQAPYDAFYSAFDLGAVPGVPTRYGGVNFALGNVNQLILGGDANTAAGGLYLVNLTRDTDGHITGFSGNASLIASAPYNDGGVAYGPGNVLFMSRWPVNELGQYKPGSTVPDKVIDIAALGGENSHAAINFVPSGFSGAGRMKLLSWSGGQWADAQYAPDGFGTYSITGLTILPDSRLVTGPEGFFYVPRSSPGFANPSMIVAEYSYNDIAAYEVDSNGDPIPSTRQVFLSGSPARKEASSIRSPATCSFQPLAQSTTSKSCAASARSCAATSIATRLSTPPTCRSCSKRFRMSTPTKRPTESPTPCCRSSAT